MKAVGEWAAKDASRRYVIALAMFQRLSECAADMDGDATLEVVSDLFEDYEKEMSEHLAHTIGELVTTAHTMAKLTVHGS
jgi:ubiquinone biosynthesis protein UbiJ